MKVEELREAGNPYWVDVQTAGEFLGLADKTILHAGPPIEFARMCEGHRRGMASACLFEGWAKDASEAVRLLESGGVKLAAACDYATNGSGYGIITKSVPLLIIEDRDYGSRAGLFPAEGRFGGGFCGWGVYSDEIAANLAWLRDVLFRDLVSVLKDVGGFPLKDIFAEARRMGDELHSSQKAIDALFTRAIVPYALKCGNAAELLDYFASTNRQRGGASGLLRLNQPLYAQFRTGREPRARSGPRSGGQERFPHGGRRQRRGVRHQGGRVGQMVRCAGADDRGTVPRSGREAREPVAVVGRQFHHGMPRMGRTDSSGESRHHRWRGDQRWHDGRERRLDGSRFHAHAGRMFQKGKGGRT